MTLRSFAWGQTNYLSHLKQPTAGVCIDKNPRQEGDHEFIAQSDKSGKHSFVKYN